MQDKHLIILFVLFAVAMVGWKHYIIINREPILNPKNHCYLTGYYDDNLMAEVIDNTMKICPEYGVFDYRVFNTNECRNFASENSYNKVRILAYKSVAGIDPLVEVATHVNFDSSYVDFGPYMDICGYDHVVCVGLDEKQIPMSISFYVS